MYRKNTEQTLVYAKQLKAIKKYFDARPVWTYLHFYAYQTYLGTWINNFSDVLIM